MQKYSSKDILLEDGHSIVIDGQRYDTYGANYIFSMDRQFLSIGFRREKKISLNDKVEDVDTNDVNHEFTNHRNLISFCEKIFGNAPWPHTPEDGCFGRGWLINNVVYIAWWNTSQDVKGFWHLIERYLFDKFDQEVYFSYGEDEATVEDEWIRVK